MEFLLVVFITGIIMVIGYWIVCILSAIEDFDDIGLITYSKFKKIFNADEWIAPRHFDNGVLIKDNFNSSRMCVESSTYLYEGKVMLPMTPYDLFMIHRTIRKTVREKKFNGKKEGKKLFMW